MFERILIPLDGSPRAELILTQIARILRLKDSEIILCQSSHVPLGFQTSKTVAFYDQVRGAAKSYLEGVAARFSDRGARVRVRVGEGSPEEVILDAAAAEGATMIAMTTHGRSGIARWSMGSVAEKVARASAVPVLLVRSFRRSPNGDLLPAAAEELPFRRILVPVDGSPPSAASVGPALEFGKLTGAEMVVLHVRPLVIPPSPILPGMEAAAPIFQPPTTVPLQDPVVTPAADRFGGAGLKVTPVSVEGDAAAEILDRSATQDIDLIVMGTHGRSGLPRWLTGSVAERVLRAATVPLLLVRDLQR
jgi:nucleotide-binding universal stress UspA family protein